MTTFLHNSQQTEYRNPTGALPAEAEVTLALRAETDAPGGFQDYHDLSCTLHLWLNEKGGKQIPMNRVRTESGALLFSVSLIISEEPDLAWYYFILDEGGSRKYYGNNDRHLGGEGRLYDYEPPAFQITVYNPAAVPEWFKGSVAYQIFPDRFARSGDWQERQAAAQRGEDWKGPCRIVQQDWNDTPFYTRNEKGEITRWPFFGGGLQGIRSKLLYLKSMGVGSIYLNPIFTAASNHKYDTADYMEIDPSFGTIDDFRALAQDARRLGIRLILDGVFNHTGVDSVYFNKFGNYPHPGAYQGPSSPYYSWYKFRNFPDDYESWWGVKDLPDIDENEPSYREFICRGENSVIRKWLREGASGWRLDVADELPDDFISDIRHAVKETDPEGLLMGEVWEDASNKISYDVQRRYLLGDELDSTMNYPVRELLTDFILGRCAAGDAVGKLRSLAENYPPENFYGALNLIGSHDRMRILTMLGDAPADLSDTEKEHYRLPEEKLQLARRRLKLLSLFQYVLPGVPCLYYGDEAGLQGYEDPYNRGTYPWGQEDEELMTHYRMLASLRRQYRALTYGAYRFSEAGENILICSRTADASGETIIAVVNRNTTEDCKIQLELPKGTGYVLELLASRECSADGEALNIRIPALSARLFFCAPAPPEKAAMQRSAGILMHVSSLPSGRLDEQAEYFVDYLEESGQKLWQILPLNPPDPISGSPYSSPSVFAGNTEFTTGILSRIDWDAYDSFCRDESWWLDDYALYTVIKERYDGAPWQQWPKAERDRENLDFWREDKKDAIELIKHKQFVFHMRWRQIRAYANEKGVTVIGDIPIYAAPDSVDTWAHRGAFLLDDNGYPLAEAGVPPDYFNEEGQHWGNPLYDWDYLKANDYDWWLERIRKAMKDYDFIRLDHFRSFAAFFAVPAGKKPRDGWWLPGVGKEFFDFLTQKLGSIPVLAEDLGFLDTPVYNLLKLTGYPGMDVYQFTWEDMETMPDAEASNRVFYSGTHDNQTLTSWCRDSAFEKSPDEIIRELYESKAPWVITPLQDVMGLTDECRMNTPGTTAGNWKWHVSISMLTDELARKLKKLASETNR